VPTSLLIGGADYAPRGRVSLRLRTGGNPLHASLVTGRGSA
jgi:hypothetical protein